MPLYTYRWGDPNIPEACDFIDREFPVGTAPADIVEKGRIYRRVYTPPMIAFKGSGFYSTDNRGPYIAPEVRREMKEKRGE